MYSYYHSRCVQFLSMLAVLAKCDSDNLLRPEELANLDDFMENIMQCRNIPGLTLSIVKDSKVLKRAYGKADLKNDVNATPESIFCLGSLTKAFTVTLLASLLPEKYPETVWDTRIKDILGDTFRLVDDVRTNLTTVKDILAHRTGLIRGDLGIYAGYPDTVSREFMVRRLRHLPARYGFRDKLAYNNWMYMLAGYIAEVLAEGESWEKLLQRKILQPLDMNSTILLEDLHIYANTTLAIPYRFLEGDFHQFPLDHYRFHPEQPAGSVCSSGSDMVKWMQFLLKTEDDAKVETNNLVNIPAFAETKKAFMSLEKNFILHPEFPVSHVTFGAGLGWFIGSYRGHRQMNHHGALLASSSLLWVYPDKNMGIFIASNRQARDSFSELMAYYVSDVLLGETPWLNTTTSCTFPQPWLNMPIRQNTSTAPSDEPKTTKQSYTVQRPRTAYIGRYGNRLFGDMIVSVKLSWDKILRVKLGVNFEGIIFPDREKDTFSLKFIGPYWFFTNTTNLRSVIHFFEQESGGDISSLAFAMNDEIIFFNRTIAFDDPETVQNTGIISISYLKLNILCFYVSLKTISLVSAGTERYLH